MAKKYVIRNKLKYLCDLKEITIRDLAKEINTSESALYNFSNNNSWTTPKTLEKIITFFKIKNIDELLEIKEI